MSISSQTLHLKKFQPAENKKELKKFIGLPWKVYKDFENWIPPLRVKVLDDLDTKKNPFYKHANICLWNAYRGKEHVGRIAAIYDKSHNDFQDEEISFFGFFECMNDTEAAKALLNAAEEWGKDLGFHRIRGPVNPSFNHSVGLLVNGFDLDPMVMMTQNPPYYADLIESAGYTKEKDLLAYTSSIHKEFPDRVRRIAEKVAKKHNVSFRKVDMKNLDKEEKLIREVYNRAWEKNWGFVPMNDEEFTYAVKSLKDLIVPEMSLVAEVKGKPVGMSVPILDVNQILKTIPSGRLFPTGFFKLMTQLNLKRGVIDRVRFLVMGVVLEYQHIGLAPVIYYESYKEGLKAGVKELELGWILEDNHKMNSVANILIGNPSKTYRVYSREM